MNMRSFISLWSKRTHTNGLIYKVLKPFFHGKREFGKEDIDQAFAHLLSIRGDNGKTCLQDNYIEPNPQYDLQIIIPTYNVELYLEECMQSIFSQKTNYKYFISIIDDASTDSTRELLKKYEGVDNISITYQKVNGEQSPRNRALKHICASYVMFLDSDDMLSDNAINLLMDEAKKTGADIVEGGFIRFGEGRINRKYSRRYVSTKDWTVLWGYPCMKVYRSYLFDDQAYPTGYWYPDTNSIFTLFNKAKRVSIIPDIVYYYRQNVTSESSRSHGSPLMLDKIWVTRSLLEDKLRLGQSMDLTAYEMLLLQIHNNYTGTVSIEDEDVNFSVFMISCHLIYHYFPSFVGKARRFKSLEKALINKDYSAYRLYCDFQ